MTDEERRKRNAEKTRRWRAANLEKAREMDRRHYLKTREKRLAYEARPERRRLKAERMRRYRASDPATANLKFRAWKYGLTTERLAGLLAAGCAVCGSKDRLHIDHGRGCCPPGRGCVGCVRGVLCNGCNTALGLLGESPERIKALLKYTKGFKRHGDAALESPAAPPAAKAPKKSVR